MFYSQWWQHHGQPQPVLDNDQYKLLYDFLNDSRIIARPDLVFMDKHSSCTKHVACVMDRHVIDKHRENIKKYITLGFG